ncbi:FAD dependent oxidoreductase [Mycena capillaripes]|nr:FAD dependent oxidoreductase [Mycena capillaripes]
MAHVLSRTVSLLSLLGLTSALSIPQIPFNVAPPPAALPHSNPTHSFWTHTPGANPLADTGSRGPLTPEADVCIIGAGMTGVSTAYHLARTVKDGSFPIPDGRGKLRAVIFEARDFCVCRNGGNLTPASFLKFRQVEAQFGRTDARRYYAIEQYSASEMVRIAHAGGWAGAVDLVAGGHIDAILTEGRLTEVQADFDAAIAAGESVNVTWVGREEMNATYGTYSWGVHAAAYNFWPLKFVTQLFNEALNTTPLLDLRLHTRTPVTAVHPTSSATNTTRWSLSTPRGTVRCSSVLHATNGYASHLLPHMAGDDATGIVPVRGQVLAVRPPPKAAKAVSAGMSWSGGGGYWFPRLWPLDNQDNDPRPLVILGGMRDAVGPPFETHITDDSTLNADVGEALRAFLPGMFPGGDKTAEVEVEAEWTGIMGYTALEIPFVGPVLSAANVSTETNPYAGQFIAAGYAGHGMPRAFACAEAVVGMMAAERTKQTWVPPVWFPNVFLTSGR